jgi:hypothetical protein
MSLWRWESGREEEKSGLMRGDEDDEGTEGDEGDEGDEA